MTLTNKIIEYFTKWHKADATKWISKKQLEESAHRSGIYNLNETLTRTVRLLVRRNILETRRFRVGKIRMAHYRLLPLKSPSVSSQSMSVEDIAEYFQGTIMD